MGISVEKFITIADYLEMEAFSDIKHEYYQGEIFAMASASIEHNRVIVNTLVGLGGQLKGKACRPYVTDLRVSVQANTLYTYPDITVICGEIEKTADTFDTVTNPTVIIEVLSESTKDYDRGSKFTLYREIPQLKEYLLIDATGKVSVEHFSKNLDGLWVLKEYKDMDSAVFIPSIDVTLLMADIYSGVY